MTQSIIMARLVSDVRQCVVYKTIVLFLVREEEMGSSA